MLEGSIDELESRI